MINECPVHFSLHNNQIVGMSRRTGEVEDRNAGTTEKRKTKGRRTATAMRTTMEERMTW